MAYLRDTNYFVEVAKGDVNGATRFHKFGRAEAVGTGGADVWTAGTYRTWITAAETVDIVSTNVNDTVAGTRARVVTIQGLDANFDTLEEDVNLNGVTPVTTAGSYIRVNRMFVKDVGTYGTIIPCSNQGVISATGNTSTTLLAQIDVVRSQTEQTHYTVPAGSTLYVSGINISGGDGTGFKCYMVQRQEADDTAVPVRAVRMVMDFRGNNNIYPPHFIAFPEKTDVWFIGLADSGTTPVYVNWYGLFNTRLMGVIITADQTFIDIEFNEYPQRELGELRFKRSDIMEVQLSEDYITLITRLNNAYIFRYEDEPEEYFGNKVGSVDSVNGKTANSLNQLHTWIKKLMRK